MKKNLKEPLHGSTVPSVPYDSLGDKTAQYFNEIVQHANQTLKPCDSYDYRVSKALKYIELHYNEQLSLQKVAAEVGLCGGELNKKMKRAVGQSFLQTVHEVRVARAMEQISKTNKTMADISHLCGFGNTKSFRKIFRKMVGYTPKDFRKTGCAILLTKKHKVKKYFFFMFEISDDKITGSEEIKFREITPEQLEVLKKIAKTLDPDQK